MVLLGDPAPAPTAIPSPGSPSPPGAQASAGSPGRAGRAVRLDRITESVEHDAASLPTSSRHRLRPGDHGRGPDVGPDGTLTLVLDHAAITRGPAMTERMFIATA